MVLEDENLDMEFPHIRRRLLELHMGFIFQEPSECNISVVREFYAKWKTNSHSHYVTLRGVEVPFNSTVLKQLLVTVDASSNVLTGINISPPYLEIWHTLCEAQSTTKWIRHRHCDYHQFYPYSHMNREARV